MQRRAAGDDRANTGNIVQERVLNSVAEATSGCQHWALQRETVWIVGSEVDHNDGTSVWISAMRH